MISSTKVCIKKALIFKIWMYYGAIMIVYSQKIATKKAIKNSLFSAIPYMRVPFKSYLEKPFLEYWNSNISRTTWPNFKNKNIMKSFHYGLSDDKEIKYFRQSFNLDWPLKVACMVEISEMLYFIIFDGRTVIYLKYWCANVEKDFYRQ